MKHFAATLFLFLFITANILAQTSDDESDSYNIEFDVRIPTQSGVDISAIIATKQDLIEPSPVVLFYTTYHQGNGDAIFAKLAADRGYVGVVAYARGVRTNMEHYTPYDLEPSDIYHIID